MPAAAHVSTASSPLATPSSGASSMGAEGRGEIAALDGVRGLAMLLVLCDHLTLASLTFGPVSRLPAPLVMLGEYGESGLHLFFILSGFLLFLPYSRALLTERPLPSVKQFYTRRARRILPLYFLATLPTLILLLVSGLRGAGLGALAPFAAIVLLFHNMQPDAWRLISNFDTPLWSLAVEWQFYLVLPWLALACAALLRRIKVSGQRRLVALLGMLGGLAAFGLAIRCVAAALHYGAGFREVTAAPHGFGVVIQVLYGLNGGKYIESFAIGMATSVLYVASIEQKGLSRQAAGAVARFATVAGFLGLGAVAVWMYASRQLPFPPDGRVGGWPDAVVDWPWAVFGVWAMGLCWCAVIYGTVAAPGVLRRLWISRPMRHAGKISYSGYVWHNIIMWRLVPVAVAFGALATPALFVITLIAVLVVSTASYWVVERPFLPASRRIVVRKPLGLPAPSAELP